MTTSMPARTGLRYAEIGARDLGRSRDFYCGLLGFSEVDAPFGPDGADVAWFAAGLALLRVVEVAGDADGGWVDDDLQAGIRHIGFKVGDVDAQVARLVDAGVRVLSPPRDVLGDVRIAFFLDPDGARLEYIQGDLTYEHVISPTLVAAEAARTLAPDDGPRFDHVGMTVADLDGSLDVWCGALGYEVIGDIRHHDDERGFCMTYLQAGGPALEVFSFDVPTNPPPTALPGRGGLRGVGVGVPGDRRGVVPAVQDGVPVAVVITDD